MFQTSVIYEANYTSDCDINVNQGGTSSGKTYSILQVLDTIAVEDPGSVITIVGQDIPNLKAGALRDQMDIVASSPELQSYITDYHKSDRIYTFFNDTIIEFKSYDSPQDAKSGKRDYLFVNEANGISYQIFDELNTRTKKKTFIDYNPNCEFWVHRELIGKPNVKLIISDYRHNPYCPQKIIQKIESRRESDPEWFKVYGRGMTGRIEGLVFRNWYVVPAIPGEAKFIGYGLDFGFTNDPTALVEVYMQNGELWVNELIYETGLTNQDIDQKLKEISIPVAREITADSAEPKSIEELTRMNWNIRPAAKGPDSVKNSIDILKRYKINVTQRSTNLRKELNAYRWKVDKQTNLTKNEPVDIDNHAIDALRYLALNRLANTASGNYSII
jgi:phage terminase large subunit